MTRRLAEVARKVGVSEATVSRVLNGKPGVSESTRQAVLTALDVLGYERPTKLRGERARLVGLVLPELQNPIFPAFAEVVGVALAQQRLHARPVHPDRGRRVRGRLRRAAAPAAGLGRRVRRRPLRAGATRRTATTRRLAERQPADGPRQRLDRRPRRSRASSCDDAVAVEQAHGPPALARPHADRRCSLGPQRPRAVEPQARGGAGDRRSAPASPLAPRPDRALAVLARGRPGRRPHG